ncbi:hypothetical protein BH23BAC3_BH23BAC3_35360 [soil metagenome]
MNLLCTLFVGILLNACLNNNHQNAIITDTLDVSGVPTFKIQEEFKITEFNDGDFFGYVYSAYASSEGTIFVGDPSNIKIQLFNYNGTYKGYLGGYGAGPGEFRRISDISLLTPDTLLVVDVSLARLTIYSIQNNEWALEKTIDYPLSPEIISESGIYGFRNFSRIKNGYVGVYESTISSFKSNSDNYISVCFVMYDDNLETIDTSKPICYDKLELIVNQNIGSSVETVSAMPIPNGYQTLFTISDKGDIITTWTGGKTISIQSFDSTKSNGFEYHSAKIPITTNIKQDLVNKAIPNENHSYFSKKELIEKIPPHKGFAEQMLLDDENQLWILTRSVEDNLKWLIYDITGNLNGRVLHPGGQFTQIIENKIYVANNSEKDPSFSVYEIQN